MTAELLDDLAKRFAFHANIYAGITPENASPLYAHLSRYVATDANILGLVLQADRSTQVSNLLFGAVHYLLLSGEDHPLRAFYASVTPYPDAPEHAHPVFRDFCLRHAHAIQQLVTTRRVQTNEVQRCTGLLPAISLVADRVAHMPLSLIEIGSSAGLHLLWDHYGYNYERIGHIGDATSDVQLHCSLVGPHTPVIAQQLPAILSRQGIDLHPINLADADAMRWIRALIWPEQTDRAALFARAVAVARRQPPHILAGNAADVIQQAVDVTPKESMLCIFHSYTLNQCSEAIRGQIEKSIEELADARDIFRISLEWYSGQTQPHLELYAYTAAERQHELLAYCESHGRSIEWLRP